MLVSARGHTARSRAALFRAVATGERGGRRRPAVRARR
jgi:hypothetical protein